MPQSDSLKIEPLDAQHAVEILSHAGASPRRLTRENALAAWALVAECAPSKGVARQAVDGLVNATLLPLEDAGEQFELMKVAKAETDALGPELREETLAVVLAHAKVGSKEGLNAARFAMLLTETSSTVSSLAAYFRLFAVRLVVAGRIAMECLPVLLVPMLLVGLAWVLLGWASALPVGEPQLAPRGQDSDLLGPMLTMMVAWCAIAWAWAALSVPSRLLRSWPVRAMETLLLPTSTYILFFLNSSMQNVASAVGLILGLVSMRLVSMWLPLSTSLFRQVAVTVFFACGWSAAAMLLAAAALHGYDSSPLLSNWSSMLWLQLAAAAGLAWAEVRGLPLSAASAVRPSGRARTAILWLGPLAATSVMLVGYFLTLAQVNKANEEWKIWISDQKVEKLDVTCPGRRAEASQVTKPSVPVRLHVIYRVEACSTATLVIPRAQIVVPEGKKEESKASRIPSPKPTVLNDSLYQIGGDNIFGFSKVNIEQDTAGEGRPSYVCFSIFDGCPSRATLPTGLAAAAIWSVLEARPELAARPPKAPPAKTDFDEWPVDAFPQWEASERRKPGRTNNPY